MTLTRKGGRGWTLDVEPTAALARDVTVPLLEQLGGLDPALRALVRRSVVGEDAKRYSIDVMKKTNLAIVLIEGPDVGELVEDPLAIFGILDREAAFALEVKPLVKAATRASRAAKDCPLCGETVSHDVRFCPHCGHRFARINKL